MADPYFHHPASVDLLLGSGASLSLLSVGQINLSPPGGPDLYLQKTRLGWVNGGSPTASCGTERTSCHATSALQFDLAQFWEIEEGPQVQHLSDSDKTCERHFQQHTTRNADGRYTVALPFNPKIKQLGESKSQALKRFYSLERKLQCDATLSKEYHAVMNEYPNLGHMKRIPENRDSSDGYYLPHHGVAKVTSESTKLRVIFDGSAATSTGTSLNDTLHTDPRLQDDLIYILLRFRIHRFVLIGDIEKMYRYFLIQKYQRILWRDTDGRIQTYQLKSVTFGISAVLYLAIRCLTQLAHDEEHRFPYAARILLRDFYVDDALTGASTIEGARTLRDDLIQLLELAGLNIRQWVANHEALLDGLPDQAINKKLHLGESSTLKTLGIVRNASDDTISYEVKASPITSRIIKRSIASEIAKIYDPLGLIGPIIIIAKIMLQKIWTIKTDWDESLPMDIHTEWTQSYKQLPLLNNTIFHRRTILNSPIKTELHGFCDASEKAYGACL